MKFQNSVNALSDPWNRCTSVASANVGGCSVNEMAGMCLHRITRISSQIIVPSTSAPNTGAAPVKTLEDAKKREVVVGATSPGSSADTDPKLMNALVGTKFKVILGYKGTTGAMLAMERGDLAALVPRDGAHRARGRGR